MDRLRDLRTLRVDRGLLVALSLLAIACNEKPGGKEQAPSRFQAVSSPEQTQKAASAFCEMSFPRATKKWVEPPSRPMPKKVELTETTVEQKGVGWTWINLWASWCGPCLKELPLIDRWRETLGKEGLFVKVELWSVDASEPEFVGALNRPFPGEVKWLRSEDDLPALLESLGVDKSSAIPVHALVDSSGNLRCVRVGSISEGAYGQIKAILAGG